MIISDFAIKRPLITVVAMVTLVIFGTFALFNLGTGPATVQPYVRVSGPSGTTATILHRCVTAEGTTS